ncbi:MAG: hypothetical protein LQ338_004592 [Usnochroma carphineum]|nr:MAG: hypothetical protein LQ338_004592 [Usnochroma carphineum]
MPLGIIRLNAHQTHPNDRIIFIKPLPGPSSAYAQDFLSRIAAICKPIMASAHLSVTTLEEYEPNREFVGRNFNNGEIIQLVLKAPGTGRWLSFRSVQMVMMHELAHCVHMNHGREFWKTRNGFAGELRGLWGKGYTGDGFWGRGKTLLSESYEHQGTWEEEVMPERLCGGTFRTRRRGRKRKQGGVKTEEGLTWKERKERRIERKFGKNGQVLGSEEEVLVKLENGKKLRGKPRVAGSARGRELRAAAALARFGAQKEEEVKEEAMGDESQTGSESDPEDMKPETEALDLDGSRLLDSNGRGMVKICEDEDEDDIYVKQEMDEMHDLANIRPHRVGRPRDPEARTNVKPEPEQANPHQEGTRLGPAPNHIKREHSPPAPIHPLASARIKPLKPSIESEKAVIKSSCPVCSMANEPSALVCSACSHVLKPRLMPDHWTCQSSTCEGTMYINVGDCGVCGVCGSKKPSS